MIHKQTQNITIRLVLIVCGVMENGNCGLWELYSFSMVPSPKAKSMCVSRSGTGRWIPNIVCKLDNDKIWRKLKHLDPYDIHHTLGYHPNIASENKVKKEISTKPRNSTMPSFDLDSPPNKNTLLCILYNTFITPSVTFPFFAGIFPLKNSMMSIDCLWPWYVLGIICICKGTLSERRLYLFGQQVSQQIHRPPV